MIRSSGTFHTPMPLALKPARRWNRIAATRRSSLRSCMPSRCASSRSCEMPERCGGGRVGLGDHRHVALERADHGDVELVVGLGLGLGRLDRLGGRLGQRLGAALHLQVHADLEQLQRRQLADRLGAGLARQHVERALQPERRVGLGGDREPDVELVVAQVVVRDAGVRVDDVGRPPRVLGIDLGRDQHRRVAERAGVEDRRDLADDPLVEQVLDAGDHLLLGDAGLGGHVLVGTRGDRELPCIRLSRRLSSSSSGIAAPCLRLRSLGPCWAGTPARPGCRVASTAAIARRPWRGR